MAKQMLAIAVDTDPELAEKFTMSNGSPYLPNQTLIEISAYTTDFPV